MNEHDNRYPEFARAYEPVKGGKKHKALNWNPLPLIVAAFLLLLLPLITKPAEQSPVPPAADTPVWTVHAHAGEKEMMFVVPEPEPGILPKPSPSATPVPPPVTPAPPTPTPADPTPVPPVTPEPAPEPSPSSETDERVRVVITGTRVTDVYNGDDIFAEWFDYAAYKGSKKISAESFTVEFVETDGVEPFVSGINVGTYYMGLTKANFEVTSGKYSKFSVEVRDGYVKITPASVTVTVTGNTNTVDYDGETHIIEGYSVSIPSDSIFTEGDIVFSGTARAEGREAGTYNMGLKAGQFSSSNSNFKVKFNVTDGWLKINSAAADHTPPDVSLGKEISAVPENNGMHFYVGFDIHAWNDLADGTMKATLYTSADGGATYTAHTDSTKTISGSSGETYAEVDAALPGTAAVYKGKIVLEYTYSDGSTGSAELGPVNLHTDGFAYINNNFGDQGWDYDINGNLSVDVIIDDTKVDPDTVDFEYASFTANGEYVPDPAIRKYTGTDGKQHIQVGVMKEIIGETRVSCTIILKTTDSEGSPWVTTLSHSGTVNN